MIIIPETYKTGTTHYLPTAANFPGLKQLLLFREATHVNAVLTDSVSGITIGGADVTATQNADGTISFNGALQTLTGTLPAPGTKNVFVVMVGKPSATGSAITFGSVAAATNFGYKISAIAGIQSTWAAVAANGASVLYSGAVGLAGDGTNWRAYGVYIDFAATTTIDAVDYDGTTFTARTQGTLIDATMASGITTMTAAMTIAQNARPWGVYVMHLTSALTAAEREAAVAWAYWAATQNNKDKIIAPFLRART